ncbi:MAG: PAS domain S-box protein, partial [Treponema sp.]|nr:PAS domain S-box protein [Treponema sp.]
MFAQFRSMLVNYSAYSERIQKDLLEQFSTTTLSGIARHIEKMYPVLHDTHRLKQEAGTEWFWDISDDFHNIATIFSFAYIYYIEKNDDNYIFLISSGIRRDEHPEWLGGPVWEGGAVPAFIDEAWKTKQLTISPQSTVNEWGELLSAALPVIQDGNVVGILGVDYDISFLNDYMRQELRLQEQQSALIRRLQNILIVATILIIVFMGWQVWLSSSSVIVPAREAEADERTRLMLDATPMICTLWDTNGNLLDCNSDTLNILGLADKQDFLGHFFELNPEYQPNGEKSRDMIQRFTRTALETGHARYEWLYRAKAGDIPVDVTAVRVPWKNSWRIACYARDLRMYKAKEALVNETEERLRIMLDTMTLACFFFDSIGGPVDCNQRAADLFGCKDKKELLENFYHLSPEYQNDGRHSREKAHELIKTAFESGKKAFLFDHIRTDGTPLPVEVTLIRVEWKGSYRIVAYLRDLSKIVETENNLKRMMILVESSPNLAMFLGPGGNIEYMNPAVCAVTGFTQEELERDGLATLFSPENFERLTREYIAEALKNKRASFEMIMTLKNGEERDFSFSVFSVQINDGSTGLGLIGRDITEFKRMQMDLAAAKEEAERALTSEIQYNKAKNDFLSKVSHELRTPLNAIIGITSIAEKTGKKTEMDGGFAKIREASEQLLWLVNGILDMAGFDTDSFDFAPMPFSFHKAMDSVITSIAQKTRAKRQIFIADIDSDIHDWVYSDERRLKQVLLNLLNNAVKFTPEKGTIELSAQTAENDGNECTVCFEVKDSGIGITPKMLSNMGEIFEQEDNSITRSYGGIGLGLPLTKRIVDLMGGKLWVDSERGKGSRFICYVRLGVLQQEKNENSAAGDSSAVKDLTGKRILVVDDVDINREIILALLEDTGAILDEAKDGDEAVEMFSQNKYDLVFM